MRVISGKSGGLRLEAPKGLKTRPTSDRIKESLFNMIAFDVKNIKFLDLFSGTGGIGIEALSRGSKEVVFIENSKIAYKCIKNNLKKSKLHNNAIVIQNSVDRGLFKLGKQDKKFSMIFMDPPYEKNMVNNTIKLILKNKILASNGCIIIEHSSSEIIDSYKELVLFREKQYKKTTISFLKGKELE